MSETVEEPRCARCGCTRAEHHKLHCEGRDGNCMCSAGWAEPATPLTAFDKVCQAENAEYDAAKAAPTYDGRISALCRESCDVGECGKPLIPGLACGGCCGCLGGCVRGWEEQDEEARRSC